jgi:hypothetical protein
MMWEEKLCSFARLISHQRQSGIYRAIQAISGRGDRVNKFARLLASTFLHSFYLLTGHRPDITRNMKILVALASHRI